MDPAIGYLPTVPGTDPAEQDRLVRLSALLDPPCLRSLGITGAERVLDVGSGLGILSRSIARSAPARRVVAVERDGRQLEAARRLADASGEAGLVEWRVGDAHALPLTPEEWGTFDVALARYVVEHSPTPERIVAQMARAVRPGGRVVLIVDDYAQLPVHPTVPELEEAWGAFCRTLERMGLDPWIGRRLPELLRGAGLGVRRADWISFGGCAGEEPFDLIRRNFVDLLSGAREHLLADGGIDAGTLDDALLHLADWRSRPEAALGYGACYAEARRPSPVGLTLTP